MAIIRDIEKGGGEIIRVEISEFRGKQYLNIRTWYTDRESGEYKPTQKGVSIRPEMFAALKEAILTAEPEMQSLLGGSSESAAPRETGGPTGPGAPSEPGGPGG